MGIIGYVIGFVAGFFIGALSCIVVHNRKLRWALLPHRTTALAMPLLNKYVCGANKHLLKKKQCSQ